MIDVIIYDTVGGPIDMSKPQGGCETSLVLLRDALIGQGLTCEIMHRDEPAECRALVICRYTPRPKLIAAQRTVVYSVDMPDTRYDQHRGLPIVCISQFHALQFAGRHPGFNDLTVIYSILGDHVYEAAARRTMYERGRWIYASAANKGLFETLQAWKEKPAGKELWVTTTGYDEPPKGLCEWYGAKWVGRHAPADMVDLMSGCEGLFYRNVAPETLGVTTCIARELGLKFDVKCVGHESCSLTEAMSPIDQRASVIGKAWAEYLILADRRVTPPEGAKPTRSEPDMVPAMPAPRPPVAVLPGSPASGAAAEGSLPSGIASDGRIVMSARTTVPIALAIPHTPWVPERVASMQRLRTALDLSSPQQPIAHYREFTDREPNTVWAEKMWRWLVSTGAEWCLQLQDDVEVAPNFWPALRAMLGSLPSEAGIVGLTSVHPMASLEIARRGERWYRTPSQLVGWAYALRRDVLETFLTWRERPGVKQLNEDEQIANFATVSGLGVWHPTPAICDHDTGIKSNYGNDACTMRRPTVTWRAYQLGDIESVDWWRPNGMPECFDTPVQRACWFCRVNREYFKSGTGASICPSCIDACLRSIGRLPMLEDVKP